MSDPDSEATVTLRRLEWNGDATTWAEDQVAAEAPLEIRIGGVPVAVVMRTPGHDEELVRGFLLSERIAVSAAAIISIRHCTDIDLPDTDTDVPDTDPDTDTDGGDFFPPGSGDDNRYFRGGCACTNTGSLPSLAWLALPALLVFRRRAP